MVKVNVISKDNGVGLTADYAILRSAIDADWRFIDYQRKDVPTRTADVNIFLENVVPRFIPLARRNILIPNAEWFQTEWRMVLPQFTEIWAKTRDCQRIFSEWHPNVIYTSFTSLDKNNGDTRKSKNFLHVAGKSSTKGTKQVVKAFLNKNEQLLIISDRKHVRRTTNNIFTYGRMPEDELLTIQNECLFHVCTSQYEGFGHYLHEGKSCGIVLTTNAAPMNEFITDPDLLVDADLTHRMNQAKLYTIRPESLRLKVRALMRMDNDVLLDKLEYCRQSWEDNDKLFRRTVKDLI